MTEISPQSAAPPDATVIIVNWNTSAMTRECLASVFEHTHDSTLEVIVVDNASSDDSVEAIRREFPQVVLIANDDNRGFAAANNQAMEIANGRYWLLLNSDTLLLDPVIDASVRYMDEHEDVGMFGCRVLNEDRTMQATCSMYPSLMNLMLEVSGLWKLRWPKQLGRYHMTHWQRDDERDVDVISGCYLLLRREVAEQIGTLDEAFFFFGEETDWCRRCREAGWRLRFAPIGEIIHYGSVSARKLNYKRNVMLSNALVRLHRKHNGKLAAAAAWSMIMMFYALRWVYWHLAALSGSDRAKEQATLQTQVLKHAHDCWPTPNSKQQLN